MGSSACCLNVIDTHDECLAQETSLGPEERGSNKKAYYERFPLRDKSPLAIAWIGSLQAFFIFSGGLFGGPLFDRFGAKVYSGGWLMALLCPPVLYERC
ncbi:hypothetical protein BO70DRAFT_81767 [Aspergillus heteromorphus CBS 117.55]|uniref:Major facilitator superfamily (MFS) profile domain-containing protein n=1 Tax=Aspergillus heteromorphus CBS 117.55 TaxID=1448321 RepID=A0A317WX18_9EURO|nr:uncharacterized protein BO70DRAFT_81767 [Aspergillus heteromorphus CBS 117.55]PWY90929.1 hypothetical protein BO70DRAFT_81767 [Aspergillus heteromorphus CBS 117.55]